MKIPQRQEIWENPISQAYVIGKQDGFVMYIQNDGVVFSYEKGKYLLDGTELIAEYSTWIEAVNSKEFKVSGK